MAKALVSELKLFIVLSFIATFLIAFDFLKLLNSPKSLIQTITVPVQYGIYNTGLAIGKQFEFIFLARMAAKQNKALTKQLANVYWVNLIYAIGFIDAFPRYVN